MKHLAFILFFISTLNLSAQNLDLIVTSEGDSIACHIDSITSSHIYFKMMVNGNWFYTNTTLENLLVYKEDAVDKNQVRFKPGTSYIEEVLEPLDQNIKQFYASRYLFAPSAYSVGKGVKSYMNCDLFVQDFRFGITNRFSIITGTSIVVNPVYIIPTYSFQINEKSAFAAGDLFLFTTYDNFTYGNLFYGMYTRGNYDNNFTIGAGIWTSKIGENTTETIEPVMDPSFIVYEKEIKTTSPAFNFSAQLRLSSRTYFITENYWFKMNMDAIADLKGPNPSETDFYDITIRSEHYAMEETILAGMFGLRIINKKNPLKSWQISSIYVFAHHGNIPDEYKQSDWETYNNEGGYSFFPIPYISYTKKF